MDTYHSKGSGEERDKRFYAAVWELTGERVEVLLGPIYGEQTVTGIVVGAAREPLNGNATAPRLVLREPAGSGGGYNLRLYAANLVKAIRPAS